MIDPQLHAGSVSGGAASRRNWPAIAIVATVAVLAFANSIWNGFVYDDKYLILDNRWIESFGNLGSVFANGFWAFRDDASQMYRPVTHVVFIAVHALSGKTPWPYHAVNVMLHALNAVLVLFVTRRMLSVAGGFDVARDPVAVAVACLFAVHPANTEAVAWVAGVTELTLATFFLGGWLVHTRPRPQHAGSATAAAGLMLLALLSKETALVLPGLLVAWDFTVGRLPRSAGRWVARYGPMLLVVSLYVILRVVLFSGFVPQTGSGRTAADHALLESAPLFARYLALLVAPVDLSAFHAFDPIRSLTDPSLLLSSAVCLVYGVAVAIAAVRRAPILTPLLFVLLPLLPVLYVPWLSRSPFAERYLYLPTVGFAGALALVAAGLAARRPAWWRPMLAAIVVLVLVYGVGTVQRNRVWRDDLSLWTDAVTKSPGSAIVRYEVGSALAARGRRAEAIDQYVEAVRLDPSMLRARLNLGTLLAGSGRLAEAIEQFRAVTELEPELVEGWISLGNARDAAGDSAGAMAAYESALSVDPDHPDAHLHLGIEYGRRGDLERALVHLEQAARLAPHDPVVRQNLEYARRLAAASRTR